MTKISEKIKWRGLLLGLFYVFVFCLLLRNSFNYLDPDLGWHLQVGAEIARTGAVPDQNLYNYVFTGSWVDHEWLANFLVYELYSRAGYLALSALFAVLVVLAIIFLNQEARRRFPAVPIGLIIVLETFGLIASLPHFGVRLQEIGLLFTVLLLCLISRYSRRPDWRLALLLPPLFYLWASLHASFLLGLGLAAAWLGLKTLEKLAARFYRPAWIDLSAVLPGRGLWTWAAAFTLSIGVTFLTPYRFRLYSFLSGYRDSFYRSHLQEWLSQFSFPFTYWQLAYLALVVLSLCLYIYYSRGRHRAWSIDLWTFFLTVFFVFLSFQSRRHFPLLFVATFWLLLSVHSGLWPAGPTGGRSVGKPFLRIYLSACLLLVSVFQVTQTKFTADPFRSFCRDYPCGAVEFLQSRPEYDGRRLFNNYVWGGHLIWTWPERSLFIDGRLPQVAFAGHTYLEEYYEFLRDDGDIAGKLAEYGIGLVLLTARDKDLTARPWERFLFFISDDDLRVRNNLRDYLSAAPDWQLLYADETAAVYGRRD